MRLADPEPAARLQVARVDHDALGESARRRERRDHLLVDGPRRVRRHVPHVHLLASAHQDGLRRLVVREIEAREEVVHLPYGPMTLQ